MNDLGIIIDLAHTAENSFFQIIRASRTPAIVSHTGVYAIREHPRNLKDAQILYLAMKGGVVQISFCPTFLAPPGGALSVSSIVDHIDYVARLAGVDHVGIGSDFDGTADFGDASMMPRITAELLVRGYSKEDIEKILGGNVLRVMEEVWRHRRVDASLDAPTQLRSDVTGGEVFRESRPLLAAQVQGVFADLAFRVFLNGREYVPEFDGARVSLKMTEPLEEGFHVVTFEVTTVEGHRIRDTSIFRILL